MDVLKGNFKPQKQVTVKVEKQDETLEERFEAEALKHLGGSMTFVSKQKVIWDDDDAADGDETNN